MSIHLLIKIKRFLPCFLLKDDAELLDSTVKIARGQAVLDAFQQGIKLSGGGC
ncbi:hypothetical protein FD25_GL002440 [Levilactobacillus acidifarinae DSM 19394]|uniref:Uncharacterized protein n=1 Tax=Levilactobacillus acidifarinae DSM 19394 = JCM 15949 TaxID=1423715 RepID=A0A0R1LJ71_9LACO|nr:hypothetical protein [Levilactobacillus acidifarinae]KRK95979.1 hypothetical protein FD25_GL002440 [Levilactobacillus acidifarinae DSM 19394]